ncbi:MAG: LPXTG cell wall anchor domain-containing protein [Mycobacteriales bacterium]
MRITKRLFTVASALVLAGGAGLLGATAANADPIKAHGVDPGSGTVSVSVEDHCESVNVHLVNNASVPVTVHVEGGQDSKDVPQLVAGASADVTLVSKPGDVITTTAPGIDVTITGDSPHTNTAKGCTASGTATIKPDCGGKASVTVANTSLLPIKVTVGDTEVDLDAGQSKTIEVTGLKSGDKVHVSDPINVDLTYTEPASCNGGGGGNNGGGNNGGGNNNGGSNNGGNNNNSSSGGGGSSLPTTGGSTGLMVGGGTLLLLAGGVLMLVSRRRRQGTTEEA